MLLLLTLHPGYNNHGLNWIDIPYLMMAKSEKNEKNMHKIQIKSCSLYQSICLIEANVKKSYY